MADYISREEALNPCISVRAVTYGQAQIAEAVGAAYMEYLETLPAADVKPVVRSHWEKSADGGYVCYECRRRPLLDGREEDALSDYCPHCGADMREED